MKSLNYWILMLLMATSCLTLASCGDDDAEQGNENTKKCYIDTDGRHVDFKYAYLSIDEPSYSGGLYEYELEFSNIDYFYYTKKQEEIIGKKVSFAVISFVSPKKYDINSLPEGDFPFQAYYSSKKDDYYYDCEININCVKNSDGSDYCEQYYEADWNKGYQSSDLIISKTSDGLYKIEIKNLNLEAAQPGEFDIEQNKERKTTGSFYFEGRFEDISSLDFD